MVARTGKNQAQYPEVALLIAPELECCRYWQKCLIACGVNTNFHQKILPGHPHYQITWFLVLWVLIINKHHCKRNGVKRSTSWGRRPTYAVFPCKATFWGFWWSLWAFSPANLHTEWPTWIQAHLRVTHSTSFNLKQKWYQSDKGAVDGRLPSAKGAHIWTFGPLTPSANFH